jgi:hypothetical protein
MSRLLVSIVNALCLPAMGLCVKSYTIHFTGCVFAQAIFVW